VSCRQPEDWKAGHFVRIIAKVALVNRVRAIHVRLLALAKSSIYARNFVLTVGFGNGRDHEQSKIQKQSKDYFPHHFILQILILSDYRDLRHYCCMARLPDMFLLISGLTVVKYQGKRAKIWLSVGFSFVERHLWLIIADCFARLWRSRNDITSNLAVSQLHKI
jgi:hypothetical protein